MVWMKLTEKAHRNGVWVVFLPSAIELVVDDVTTIPWPQHDHNHKLDQGQHEVEYDDNELTNTKQVTQWVVEAVKDECQWCQ